MHLIVIDTSEKYSLYKIVYNWYIKALKWFSNLKDAVMKQSLAKVSDLDKKV